MHDTTTVIDSRDLLKEYRDIIGDSTADYDDDPAESEEWVELDEDERERATMLRDLLQELPESTVDSPHGNSWGSTLIREDYFEEYARELADDLGAIDKDASWPAAHIDWKAAAEDLKQDYVTVELDGHTYYAR